MAALCLATILGSVCPRQIRAQDSLSFRADRFWPGVGTLVAADAILLSGLTSLWYSGYDRTSFHWYDDWNTYVQQDKAGHLFVSWQLARVLGAYGRWSGMSRGLAGLFGGGTSALFQSQIEFLDGFSEAFGASPTDIVANFIGGALGGAQVAYPDRLSWLSAKYSYHPSPYYDGEVSPLAPLRYAGNAIKDYDGISYWLVVSPHAFTEAWPDWIDVSVGYSGRGLAHPISGRDAAGSAEGPVHRRQFFVGPDLDVVALTREWPPLLRSVVRVLSFIRIPAPALELGSRVRWHWVYF